MKRIVADPVKCMACRACELACALAHAGTDDLVEAICGRGARPRIYIEPAGPLAVPLQCRHCDDAPCVAVCPSGALSRRNESEPVLANQEKCIGCAYCVDACPFGVIVLGECFSTETVDRRRVIIKCDLCSRRLADGLEPACVSSCPVGALRFEETGESARKARALTAARTVAVRDADGRSDAAVSAGMSPRAGRA